MMSQPGQQTITIHVNAISNEVKATRYWNLVRWWNIKTEIFFFKNHAENEAGRLVPDLLFF